MTNVVLQNKDEEEEKDKENKEESKDDRSEKPDTEDKVAHCILLSMFFLQKIAEIYTFLPSLSPLPQK